MAFRRLLSALNAGRGRATTRSIPATFGSAPGTHAQPGHGFLRRYVDVSGVRVSYLEAGSGPPLVFVHGNMLDSRDFVASGIAEPLTRRFHVIAFDRPGFGNTTRPRGTAWTPVRQAALLHAALKKLAIERPIVVGHSLGSLVSVALALAHPQDVRALTLLSGYYYPRMAAAAPLLAFVTFPVVGELMRVAVAPTLGRLLRPVFAKQLFSPAPVAQSFATYSQMISKSRSHLRASLEDASYLDSATRLLESRYRELKPPVEVLAGDRDSIVASDAHSERFARDVPNARYGTIRGTGHMIHYTASDRVLAAIEAAERRSTLVAV